MNKIDWSSIDNSSKYGVITHHYMSNKTVLPVDQVNSVFVIPFFKGKLWPIKEMSIACIERGNGTIGLPGGKIEKDDRTHLVRAMKESIEEAGIYLDKHSLKVVRNVKSVRTNGAFEKPYMTIITGIFEDIQDDNTYFQRKLGAKNRQFFENHDAFLEKYNTGHKPSMKRMIAEAKELLFDTPIPETHSLKALGLI